MPYPMTDRAGEETPDEIVWHGRYATVPALAALRRGRGVWSWVVQRCPFCRKTHTHGGGPLAADPRRLLGHRVPHCLHAPDHVGYRLVEAAQS